MVMALGIKVGAAFGDEEVVASLLGGLEMFGLIGLVLGPMVFAFISLVSGPRVT